jgi:hypothetical protein
MAATYYRLGSWNTICDTCGQQRKAEELKLKWDGTRACNKCFEPRQFQDFVRGVKENNGVPWSRNRPPLTFVNPDTRPDGSNPAVVPIPGDNP